MITYEQIIDKVNTEFNLYLNTEEKSNLSPDTHIHQDLTLDSLDHAEIVMAIEDEFVIEIEEEASYCVTMSDVYKIVADNLGEGYTCGVDNKQPKENSMNTVKREDLLNTKWDAREWTQDMHDKWSSLLKEKGFNQLPFDYLFYFVAEDEGVTHTANRLYFLDHWFAEKKYNDIFPEESQTTSAITGSGVHVEEGGVNDTRKDTPNKETFTFDTLRKVCQEHGLYMTLDPYAEIIVTEVSSDVEYKVENEDQLEKLLSALEVLNSYVKH